MTHALLTARATFAILLMTLTACSDPAGPEDLDPCTADHACEVEGVDLELFAIEVESIRIDSASGLAVVPGDTLRVTLGVRNRGSDTSAPGEAWVNMNAAVFLAPVSSTPLPPIEPGGTREVSLEVAMLTDQFLSLRDDRVTVTGSVAAPADVEPANDERVTDAVVLDAPLLQLTGSAGNTRAGSTIALNLSVRNFSSQAAAPAQQWVVCLFSDFSGCGGANRAFAGSFQVPALPAKSQVDLAVDIAVPPEAVYLDQAMTYGAWACIADSGTQTNEMDCVRIGAILIRPAYEEVCQPPRLDDGAVVHLTNWNCGNPHVPRSHSRPPPFHIVSLAADANVTYAITHSAPAPLLRLHDAGGEPVPDLDPAPDRIRVGSDERIYIVMYSDASDITVRATPVTAEGVR